MMIDALDEAVDAIAVPVTASTALKVAKPFKTHNRLFSVGDDIAYSDLDGSPLDFEHMKSAGFIAAA